MSSQNVGMLCLFGSQKPEGGIFGIPEGATWILHHDPDDWARVDITTSAGTRSHIVTRNPIKERWEVGPELICQVGCITFIDFNNDLAFRSRAHVDARCRWFARCERIRWRLNPRVLILRYNIRFELMLISIREWITRLTQ